MVFLWEGGQLWKVWKIFYGGMRNGLKFMNLDVTAGGTGGDVGVRLQWVRRGMGVGAVSWLEESGI